MQSVEWIAVTDDEALDAGAKLKKSPVRSDDSSVYGLWLDSLAEHAEYEYGLVRAIWCDPFEGYHLADSLGIGQQHFRAREDMLLMFLAFRLAGGWGRQAVFNLTCRALQAEHCWSEDAHRDYRGSTWSEDSLSAFADEFCPFPTPMQAFAVRDNAAKLLELDARMRDADSHYKEAERLLVHENLPIAIRSYREGTAA